MKTPKFITFTNLLSHLPLQGVLLLSELSHFLCKAGLGILPVQYHCFFHFRAFADAVPSPSALFLWLFAQLSASLPLDFSLNIQLLFLHILSKIELPLHIPIKKHLFILSQKFFSSTALTIVCINVCNSIFYLCTCLISNSL